MHDGVAPTRFPAVDMSSSKLDLLLKLSWSLPWLMRYPFWRIGEVARRLRHVTGPQHVILIVANHFEPAWSEHGIDLNLSSQLSKVDEWCAKARALKPFRDNDGTPFRHTYFFPAEQYHPRLIQRIAELQSEELGEVEIHLHHGVTHPDNERDLRHQLEDFRNALAEEHKCLSQVDGVGSPRYAFVHGNWALANSAGGKNCGVDSEMQILAETGCYADFTLPSVPYETQVPRINAIYQCGGAQDKKRPHRKGRNLRVMHKPLLPVLFTGPLVFNWQRRIHKLPIPRVDDGSLAANYPPTIDRFHRWRNAGIGIHGRPEWVFIKLYGHGFFPYDQDPMIGEDMKRFLGELRELTEKNGDFKIHFATAREAFNIAMAAVDGHEGDPARFRDYRLRPILKRE